MGMRYVQLRVCVNKCHIFDNAFRAIKDRPNVHANQSSHKNNIYKRYVIQQGSKQYST